MNFLIESWHSTGGKRIHRIDAIEYGFAGWFFGS